MRKKHTDKCRTPNNFATNGKIIIETIQNFYKAEPRKIEPITPPPVPPSFQNICSTIIECSMNSKRCDKEHFDIDYYEGEDE